MEGLARQKKEGVDKRLSEMIDISFALTIDVQRESEKEKAYAKLERKCNNALWDMDKNPLVLDMHAEIETLQGAAIVAKVVPHVAMELVRSDEMGLLVAWLAKEAIFYGRCTTFEEVAALKEPLVALKEAEVSSCKAYSVNFQAFIFEGSKSSLLKLAM
ncbi:hypothetical protein Tco_0302613 [Tanacetum coccineum]